MNMEGDRDGNCGATTRHMIWRNVQRTDTDPGSQSNYQAELTERARTHSNLYDESSRL